MCYFKARDDYFCWLWSRPLCHMQACAKYKCGAPCSKFIETLKMAQQSITPVMGPMNPAMGTAELLRQGQSN